MPIRPLLSFHTTRNLRKTQGTINTIRRPNKDAFVVKVADVDMIALIEFDAPSAMEPREYLHITLHC